MKISLEIPDDVITDPDSEFYIHNWTTLLALRRRDGKWYVKTSPCGMCGECCRHIGSGNPMYDGSSICRHLKDNKCELDFHRPFSCIMDFHDDPKTKPKSCTEEFKEV